MEFDHSPAHSSQVPDNFSNERVDVDYTVFQDTDAEDPRQWIDDEHAALYAFSGPRGESEPVPDHPVAQAFAHFYERFDAETSLAATRRWIALFHPEHKNVRLAIKNCQGYSQSHWAGMFAVVTDGYGDPVDHIDQYWSWAVGDVWVVDPSPGDPLGGIYSESAEEALQQYLVDNPPPLDSLLFDDEHALVKALFDALVARDQGSAARLLHERQDTAFSALGLDALLDSYAAAIDSAWAEQNQGE